MYKFYRQIISILILFAFVGQMLHSEWNWSDSVQNLTGEFISFCPNKQLDTIFLYDSKIPPTSDAKCNMSFQLLFMTKQFAWEPIETKYDKNVIEYYQNIHEELYVDKLLQPPRSNT